MEQQCPVNELQKNSLLQVLPFVLPLLVLLLLVNSWLKDRQVRLKVRLLQEQQEAAGEEIARLLQAQEAAGEESRLLRAQLQEAAGHGNQLTARQAILRPVPGINQRTSTRPRRSSSRTVVVRPRTFSRLAPWDGFGELLVVVAGQLDDTERRFTPVLRAGDTSVTGFRAAADEAEVRAPMQNIAELVNGVAASMGILAEVVGGGSGRSTSATDYVVRLLRGDQEQRRQSRKALSGDVYACIEIKGSWQFPLNLGHDVAHMTLEQLKVLKLDKALQQCYGDMVIDEAPLGMVTQHNVAVLLKRSTDVTDKTLYVSPPIGLDGVLLALLVLLHLVPQLEGVKQQLPRQSVPSTPPEGYHEGNQITRRRSERLQEQQQHVSCLDTVGQQGLGEEGCKSCSGGGGASSSRSDTSGGGDASSIDKSTISTIDVPLGGRVPAGLEWLGDGCGSNMLSLELCDFADVGLTDRCAGFGRYGNVLEGIVGGVPVVVKLFEQRRQGAVDAFARELAVYAYLAHLGSSAQNTAVPRLLRHGMFAHTGALFLAVTDEGDGLEAGASSGGCTVGGGGAVGGSGSSSNGGGITLELRAAMVKALRTLHQAGVLHGDIRLSNFVVGQNGIKLVDLGEAVVMGTSEASSSHQAAMKAELQAVEVL